MERKQKVIQIYAVVICIVSVITIIISTSSLVSAIIDRSDPLYANYYGRGKDLASFENYKMDALESTKEDQAYIPDDETLHEMYEASKKDKIKSVLHRTHRSMMVSSLMILISIVLFGIHWWLLQRAKKGEA